MASLWLPAVRGPSTGDLILPNGSVHSGSFQDGRASGLGVLYDASGMVTTGSWVNNKRVGEFTTVDPKGGEWADMYDTEGKRTSRKKRTPPPNGVPGAVRCKHCNVKFHAARNSVCRQHAGKWLQAGDPEAGDTAAPAVDPDEFPEGGIWLCCGSKRKGNIEACQVGKHAAEDEGDTAGDAKLIRTADGEVVISSGRRRGAKVGDRAAALAARPSSWRDLARECILREQQAFLNEEGLVWLDCEKHSSLAPFASLAECGRTGCACTRTLYPSVRKRFREEIVRRASEARESGAFPAEAQISYVSFGSGLLLGDLDVICGLQEAGFSIESASFVDTDYRENGQEALAEMTDYLAPDARVQPFTTAAEYVAARLQGQVPAAHIFVQIDSDEIPAEESLKLSAVALTPGVGLGFRLANQHHPTLLPLIAWKRTVAALPRPAPPAGDASASKPPSFIESTFSTKVEYEASLASTPLEGALVRLDLSADYGAVLAQVDVASLVVVNEEEVMR
jgi:hypothetical protein